jgi:hypothetical protein
MEVPDTPLPAQDDVEPEDEVSEKRPSILIEGHNISMGSNANKRRRVDWPYEVSGPPTKQRILNSISPSDGSDSPRREYVKQAVRDCDELTMLSPKNSASRILVNDVLDQSTLTRRSTPEFETTSGPSIRQTNLRGLLHYIVNESLRVGGRPDSAIGQDTELGERIEVRTKTASGEIKLKVVELAVDHSVPETVSGKNGPIKVNHRVFF